MAAANRAVTAEARQRRLQLVDVYVGHLKALDAPSPFDPDEHIRLAEPAAFAWPA